MSAKDTLLVTPRVCIIMYPDSDFTKSYAFILTWRYVSVLVCSLVCLSFDAKCTFAGTCPTLVV